MKRCFWLVLMVAGTGVLFLLAGCSGGGGNGSRGSQSSTVNLHLSDPPTCSSSSGGGGAFLHVYVSITGVQVHTSATASDNDPNWVTLISLSSPRQVDLLGTASSQCFLADLGSASLTPGTYQQMRLVLASNSASISNNQCGSAGANCVVLVAKPAQPQTLDIGSGSQTGLKIPSGQIAGGQFTIASGQTKDLNIDFDACASLVLEGNGQFRLKPVLHAGEVSLTSSSISGKVVNSATGQVIPNSTAIVALELRSGSNVQVIMQTMANPDGTFTLCPVPAGSYDMVVAAIAASNNVLTAYGPTVTLGVQPGNALGNVPLTVANAGSTGGSVAPATITGQVDTQNTALQPVSADVALVALQTFNLPGTGTAGTFIIPLVQQSGATATVSTAADVSCAGGFDCANYSLALPASYAAVGTFSASGTTYAAGQTGAVNYTMMASPSLTCSGSQTAIPPSVLPGDSRTAPTISFTACQ